MTVFIRRLYIPVTIAALTLVTSAVQAAQVQVGFSPEGSAEALVLDVIQKAEHQILLMGYSFTSPKVVRALIAAKQRGVEVKVVLDARGNEGKASKAAMNLIANAGIELRTNAAYKIQHDKVIVTDGQNVETGSFNYSTAAARSNSENALVLWDSPDVAKAYTQHWQSRWDKGQAYQPGY
ncbi:phospholipase D family protein [Pseudomonas tremae]|uniref:phospholipase D family nuclease n=1 Tax=Pseudomonas syringae group TaxID=136849 RepID=UPI000EFE45BB|nr:phospholipase D family protein [Pseudomonas coronafaciens]